jgi:hypothetical protein
VAGSTKPGPTITSMIDCHRKTPNGVCVSDNGNQVGAFVIEDGCIPEPFAPVIEWMFIMQTINIKHFLASFLHSPLTQTKRTLATIKSIVRGPYSPGGAIQRTATYLAMSHDNNEVTLTLDYDEPHLQGVGEGRGANILSIKDALRGVLGGDGAIMGFSYFYGRWCPFPTLIVLCCVGHCSKLDRPPPRRSLRPPPRRREYESRWDGP